MDVTIVIGISIILQFTAAFLALRLIRVTGGRVAWILIATAIFLMGVRRSITLSRLISGDMALPPDLQAELVALAISMLMLVGIALIGPFFASVKRSAEAFQESEQKYKDLAESITNIFYAMDEQLRYTYWNRECEKLTGILAKDALGKHLYDIFPYTEATKRAERAYLRALTTKQPQHFIDELRFRGKDRIFDTSAYPTKDGLSVFAKDVTERKQAEEALRGSEGRYRALFEQAADSVVLIDAGTGALVEFNERAHKNLGYSREEFRKLKISDFEVNESVEEVANHLRKIVKEGGDAFETRHRTKDGEIRDIHVNNRVICIGGRNFIQSMWRDVTERKRAEEVLRESEERYRALVELGVRVGEAIVMRQDTEQGEGIMTFVSDEWANITGYSKEELLDAPFHELVSPKYQQASLERYRRRMRGESVGGLFELSIIRKDGTEVPIELTSAYTAYKGKRANVAFIRNITERKQAQQKVESAAKEWRTTFDTIPDLVSIHNKDFKVIRLNKAFAGACKLKPQAVVGSICYELIHGMKEPCPDCPLRQALATRKPSRSEFFNPHLGIYTEVTCSPIINGNGDAAASVHIMRDVTERRQMLGTLQESEERYRLVADNAADVIWTVDLNMRPTYMSPSISRLLGYSAEEAMAKPMEEVFTPSSFEMSMMVLAEELAVEELEQKDLLRSRLLEIHMIHKDGSIVPAEIKYTFLRDADTKPVGILAIARDITEREQAEAKLKESESKYRAIFETTGTAMIIIEEDTTISLANTEFAKLSGYSPAEIEGKKKWPGFIFKDDLERLKEYHRQRRINSDAVPKQYEARLLDRKGNIKDVYASVDIIPGTRRSVASILDMSERKQMERDLKIEARLLDTATDSIFVYTPEGSITYANETAHKSRGYSKEELMAINRRDLATPEYARLFDGRIKALLAKGEATWESIHLHKDGSAIPVEVHAQVIKTNGQKLILDVVRDITERKQMQEQLIVADRLATLGELISGVAHELNNPLTSIIGFAQLLLAKDIPPGIKEDLNVIYEEAERTSKVVRNLLTFARKHEPEKKPVNLNEAIKVVLALRAYEQRVHNIQTSTQFAPDLPEIMADGFQLQQVFLNIIINAEYFMAAAHGGGNLIITTERVGDNIRVSFTDDGSGIPQENLSRLFDPFFTTKDVGKGTGLGLSICHGIITEHGGSIYAESEPGKGATFVIELPTS